MKKVFVSLLITTYLNAGVIMECTFNKYSDKDGVHTEKDLVVTYEINGKDKVYATGNNQKVSVMMIEKKYFDSISFIEITANGNINTVTVNNSTSKAVYSRNVVILGKLFPSQHYGECAIK